MVTGVGQSELRDDADPDVVRSLAWSRERLRWEPASPELVPDGAELRPGRSVVICTYERAASLVRCLASLREQLEQADELVVVDASASSATEDAICGADIAAAIQAPCRYFRVTGRYRGLTRQRNFALDRVTRDLVAFFDDDTVLDPACLSEMEAVHRRLGDEVAGVGAIASNAASSPDLIWRLRRRLGVIPDLRPGSYARSGLSVPWEFTRQRQGLVDGDWLPGCGMMWKTRASREVRFPEEFAGYARGEDLDFSLRMRPRGRLVMACAARLQHLHEPGGRPDLFRLGFMRIYNPWEIHRRCLPRRMLRDIAWFAYAHAVDSILVCGGILCSRGWIESGRELAGRFAAFGSILRARSSDSAPVNDR
jgi:GT2 family glycosyltransferase